MTTENQNPLVLDKNEEISQQKLTISVFSSVRNQK